MRSYPNNERERSASPRGWQALCRTDEANWRDWPKSTLKNLLSTVLQKEKLTVY